VIGVRERLRPGNAVRVLVFERFKHRPCAYDAELGRARSQLLRGRSACRPAPGPSRTSHVAARFATASGPPPRGM